MAKSIWDKLFPKAPISGGEAKKQGFNINDITQNYGAKLQEQKMKDVGIYPSPQPNKPKPDKRNDTLMGPIQQLDLYAGLEDVLGAYTGRGGGGGYGGGGVASMAAAQAAYDQMKAEQGRLAETERANINARRDAAIQQIEKEYADQMAYLDTQVSGLQGSATTGKESIAKQREGTIATAQQQAEMAAMSQRDVYKDLILQGRRRARATGAGSSSGYQEITGMLDNQLARNLGQVEQTKQNQVGVANNVADQAVSQIEASLQSALGEIANNRATSLREKDRMANEARMNAADTLLEVDKWVAQTFADIETAKINLRIGGGGGYSRGGGYSASNAKAKQSASQAQILGNLENYLNEARKFGQYTPQMAEQAWNQAQMALLGLGTTPSNIKNIGGMFGYTPAPMPTSETGLFLTNPTAWEELQKAKKQYQFPYYEE